MKKVLLAVVSLVLVAALSIAGTLAYLQSEDSDVNVMTLGNVSIAQREYQRVTNDDGSYVTDTIDNKTSYVLEEFEQGKPLLPIVGDPSLSGAGYAGWDDTTVRMSQVGSYGGMQVFAGKNAQDKFVTVENIGKTDAYIRTIVAIECGEGDPALIGKSYHSTWSCKEIGVIEIDDNKYFVYEFAYIGGQLSDGSWRHQGGILPAGDTSYPSLAQVYLKSAATNEDMVAIDGNGNGTLDILVLSQAVQAAGFENAQTALDAAFGTPADKAAEWFGGTEIPTWPIIPTIEVSTPEELREAMDDPDLVPGTTIVGVDGLTIVIDNGEQYKIPGGITLKNITWITKSGSDFLVMTAGVGDTVVFEDCVVDRPRTSMTIIAAEADGANYVFNNCTFKGIISSNFTDKPDGVGTFNNCTFVANQTDLFYMGYVVCMGGTSNFVGCTFDYTGGSTTGSSYATRWSAVNSLSERYSTAVVLEGCTLTNCGTQSYGANSTLTVK